MADTIADAVSVYEARLRKDLGLEPHSPIPSDGRTTNTLLWELNILTFRLAAEQRVTNDLLARIPIDTSLRAVATYDISGIDEIPG